MTIRYALLLPLAAVLVGCEDLGTTRASATPVAPSPIAATAQAAPERHEVIVNMTDACDPDTFNNAGFGHICDRSGGIKFDDFIATLTKFGFIQAWRFAPSMAKVDVGQTIAAVNRGGETHTFTQVANFGGGIIEDLNRITNNPTPAPECTTLDTDDFVVPGATYRENVEHSGLVKFQCCIHPWMRLEAVSR